jgi:hypothetical protein
MKKERESLFRKVSLLLATTAATLGVTLGLPIKKALAASSSWKSRLVAAANLPQAQLQIVQPRYVNPSTLRLLSIAEQALSNPALAERIFREPDAVAAQYHLSKNEKLVLRHMDRTQFQTARTDAARVVANRMSRARSTPLPAGATNAHQITERMIVGRAILAAVGRSYLSAADAHDCCPWSKSIELGVSSDPALYNVVFQRSAGAHAALPAVQAPRFGANANLPAVQAPRTGASLARPGVQAPQPEMKVLRPGMNRLK